MYGRFRKATEIIKSVPPIADSFFTVPLIALLPNGGELIDQICQLGNIKCFAGPIAIRVQIQCDPASLSKSRQPRSGYSVDRRIHMTDWLADLLHSFASQAGAWFVGLVLAVLGAFSTRIVEKVKFALNRADARAKYYEEMAVDISHFVFIIDRLVNVYYGSRWASDDDKSAIASEYNEVMNKISRKEYVYRSWLQRFWSKDVADAFVLTMEKIRTVDRVLIRLNEDGDNPQKSNLEALESAFRDLREAASHLLASTT
jgi:hypothetical protein